MGQRRTIRVWLLTGLLAVTLLPSLVRACKYNVRDAGFVDFEPAPYRLVVLTNATTPSALPSRLRAATADAWLDAGAARAVLYALLQRPEVERIVLANRTTARAEALAGELDVRRVVTVTPLETCSDAVRDAGLLINTTSVGLRPHGDRSPLPDPSCLHAGMLVLDAVYDPPVTALMRQARAAGARAVNGLGMLVYQGARSFEIWTGRWPPVEIMRTALRSGLNHDSS